MAKKRVIIAGAGGRDMHNFTTYFRGNEHYEVVAFTATQVPFLAGRDVPPEVAGPDYPNGIHIYDDSELERLIDELDVDEVNFAILDVSHEYVMHQASRIMVAGANFLLLGEDATMLKSKKPVVAVNAVRTGSGKGPTARRVAELLRDEMGKKVVIYEHPNPYGDLIDQSLQRFDSYEDLDKHNCSVEEREEYEPYIVDGFTVFTGIETEKVLRAAEEEGDVIVWEGGNNDLPFLVPDLHIVVADPHRAGHEIRYHPGEAGVRRADVILINKVDTADYDDVRTVRSNVREYNPDVTIIEAVSPLSVDDPAMIAGKRVLAVEDGPSVTHGDMPYGAGIMAAERFGAELVDPRPYAVGTVKETLEEYPHLEFALPAMGYSPQQRKELEASINAVPCDVVLLGTPIDLTRVIDIKKPTQRVEYETREIGRPNLMDVLAPVVDG
jgi:predicted GTPase